ncbi:MAG: hypothetical protein M3460_17575 [Actinomycetota bacterium]|nr:hypothetical protein [Actinomycetota bacterium]
MDSDLPTRADLMVQVWDLTEEVEHLRDENQCLRQELKLISSSIKKGE